MSRLLSVKVAGDLLTRLEDLELPALSWGVTTGMLSTDEVIDCIDKYGTEYPNDLQGVGAEEVLDDLLESALLFRVPETTPRRYRTRMAETLRLTTRLRQLFGPTDLTDPPPNWWEQGKPLVADYRLHVAPRRYPRRSVSMADALGEFEQLPGWREVQSSVAAAQVGGRDLARFQVDAAAQIYRSLAANRTAGVIVGAGTGSGKTLAFYLPDFAAIAASPVRNRVHTLALYPRTELLRDQLREAVSAVRAVSDALHAANKKPIRVGTLYGVTPRSSSDYDVFGRDPQSRNGKWARHGQDAVCPYIRCPECEQELLWKQADRRANRDRLTCASCSLVLDDVVALTRDSLQRQPPDILFTTTEMLNRQSSGELGRLVLGWRSGGSAAPRLVLLDEVHTYSGVHGAQVALLLRRWRHSVRSPVTFVGLSATLKDARSFFAELTGLNDGQVESIEPRADHLISEGREYAVALRGDPVSGASLLSTSIQAAMLYGRIMDPGGDQYLHGMTGFLFTDDLDVTNRFYDDLRDAEGEQRFRWGRLRSRVLAGLRSRDGVYASARYRDGQSWDLVQQIGRILDPRAEVGGLTIGRTSSQDSGVDQDADLIVATASLEVGFNDPRVGLVLQHKAPFDPASFIQRRGRTGRRRETRPWTVVTLSDYGRDRLAYQAYDTLFSPELAARSLPVRNRSLLKTQGAEALLDWLAMKMATAGCPSDPRAILRALASGNQTPAELARVLANLLEATVTRRDLQDELALHLQRALQISPEEAQAVLWESPRSLLLSVAPTALRRLRSLGIPMTPVRADPGLRPNVLLPEFITATLFEPLNVPEVYFNLPFTTGKDESLPIERALREAVPGRVSRRFGYQRATDRTWLALPANGMGVIEVTSISSKYTREGTWTAPDREPFQVIRPHVIDLTRPDDEVTDRAQGTPRWVSQFVEPAARLAPADIPDPSPWAGRITSAGFATHAMGNPVEVRRMTTGATCETSYTDGRSVYSNVQYSLNGAPAALGFRLSADGARFSLAPLELGNLSIAKHLMSPGWRTLAFTTAVAEDSRLDGIANSFQRTWLTLVYLVSFAIEGIDGTRTPAQIHQALRGGRWAGQLPMVLRVLYRDDSDHGAPGTERLVNTLTELSTSQEIQNCLDEHGQLLWAVDVAERTAVLAQSAYRDTVAAAILAAALRACPDAREQDLVVDVVPSGSDGANDEVGGDAEIWLTETALGGLGIIEQLLAYYAEDPRRFWGLVDSTLGPNDFEYVDATLTRLLQHVQEEPQGEAAKAMNDIRLADSAGEASTALQALRGAWTQLDGYPKRSAVSALSVRLLRPGSTRATDELALGVIDAWDALQERLQFEVDARVIAFGVGAEQIQVPGAGSDTTSDKIFSMLWPRGYQARSQHLDHYQPYVLTKLLDRRLVGAARDEHLRSIDITQPGWRDEYVKGLEERGVVTLTAPASQTRELSRALREVPVQPIDRGVLRVYGTVRDVTRAGARWQATIEIKEAAQ